MANFRVEKINSDYRHAVKRERQAFQRMSGGQRSNVSHESNPHSQRATPRPACPAHPHKTPLRWVLSSSLPDRRDSRGCAVWRTVVEAHVVCRQGPLLALSRQPPDQRAEMALGAGQRTALDGDPTPTSQLSPVPPRGTLPLSLLSPHEAHGGSCSRAHYAQGRARPNCARQEL